MNELQDFEYVKFKYDKELHDVFGTVLDVFPSISSAVVHRQVYLWHILQKIKYNTKVAIESNLQLTPKYVVGRRNPAYEEKKKQLPAICYNARFAGYKDLAHLKTINNLMFLDIDDFKTEEETLGYKKEIINKYDWILACNLSLSKLGLHIIIMVDRIIDNKDFNRKYDYISCEYFDGRLDKNGKSLTRYTVIPYDNDIYINETPAVLNIDKIINTDEKSTRSAYIDNSLSESSDLGICSVYREEIISTAYTFSNWTTQNSVCSESATSNKLRFAEAIDESFYTDINTPIYIHEGIDIIQVNLYPYISRKVEEGNRTSFIGALAIQMLYLNHQSNCPINNDIRLNILRFILSTNKKVCDPPLTFNEVIKSFNANCKKFEAGDFDISKYLKKQHSFWSKDSTLSANEKRKVTCRIKNEPVMTETKRKIKSAIESIIAAGIKLTQEQVARVSGLSLSTVKKYRNFYNELSQVYCNSGEVKIVAEKIIAQTTANKISVENNNIESLKITSCDCSSEMEFDDAEEIGNVLSLSSKVAEIKPEISEEQIHTVFNRIFEQTLMRLNGDENKIQVLFAEFFLKFKALTEDEASLVCKTWDDAMDDGTYWKQGTLESKLRNICLELTTQEQLTTSNTI